MKDYLEIEKVLTIKNTSKENVIDIVGRMEILLDFFKNNKKYNSLIPFLKTYYLVTKKVIEKDLENKKYYHAFSSLERLDVTFAKLYFNALKQFIKTGKANEPWSTYFEYCKRVDGIIALQILLGINAHINGDLLIALHNSKYKERSDFLKINRILKEEIPEIINFIITEEHDILTGIEAIVARKLIYREFKEVIVKWRSDAWNLMESTSNKNFNFNKKITHNGTERIGSHMVSIFHSFPLILPETAITHFNSLSIVLPK